MDLKLTRVAINIEEEFQEFTTDFLLNVDKHTSAFKSY